MIQGTKHTIDIAGVSGAVTATVPAQKNNVKVKVNTTDPGSLANMPGGADFRPDRAITNLVLEDEARPGTVLTQFDPAFELRIRYTAADVTAAGGGQLKMAFWNGTKWVLFTAAKHQFRLEPDATPATGGHGVAMISSWGDPPIAVGH